MLITLNSRCLFLLYLLSPLYIYLLRIQTSTFWAAGTLTANGWWIFSMRATWDSFICPLWCVWYFHWSNVTRLWGYNNDYGTASSSSVKKSLKKRITFKVAWFKASEQVEEASAVSGSVDLATIFNVIALGSNKFIIPHQFFADFDMNCFGRNIRHAVMIPDTWVIVIGAFITYWI